MSPHSTVKSARSFYAVFGSATVAMFLIRLRSGMNENPAPETKPVGPEILSRLVGLVHSVISAGDGALSLLFRVALAPVNVVFSAAEFVFRSAFAGIESAATIVHLAPLYLLHWI
jgi:hypothetical protein